MQVHASLVFRLVPLHTNCSWHNPLYIVQTSLAPQTTSQRGFSCKLHKQLRSFKPHFERADILLPVDDVSAKNSKDESIFLGGISLQWEIFFEWGEKTKHHSLPSISHSASSQLRVTKEGRKVPDISPVTRGNCWEHVSHWKVNSSGCVACHSPFSCPDA